MLDKDLITAKEAAEVMGCDVQNIYHHIKQGRLSHTKVGPMYLVSKSDLGKLMAQLSASIGTPRGGKRASWRKLTDYLRESSSKRVQLSMQLVKQLTGTKSPLSFPAEWSANMARGTHGVRAYKAVEAAGYDVVQINLAFNKEMGKTTVTDVVVEKTESDE